jgi:ABC-type antimicrobial peptide transport system permease subunit
VLIGIVTLVAMVSFGVGVQREVQRNFESIGLENLFVRPIYDEPDAFDPFAEPSPQTPITPDLVAQIEQIPDVTGVTPELQLPFSIDIALTYGDTSLPIRVTDGNEPEFNFGTDPEPLAGSHLDSRATAGTVLVKSLADSLLEEGQSYDALVGQELFLTVQLPRGETETFPSQIVGVRDGFGGSIIELGLAEREAILAWWFNEPDILQTEGYDGLTVQTTDLGAITAVSVQIEELGLQTQSLEAILNVANQVLALMQALLGSVGGLALLVAALGVANTMMMAIYERTREIGILKALGASAGEIRAMFTVEAAMLGLLGGFFGLIFGTLLGRLVDWIGHRFLIAEGVTGIGQLSVVPWWLALGALAFAAFIGVVAGLYPAARAAKLDPVAALRHE